MYDFQQNWEANSQTLSKELNIILALISVVRTLSKKCNFRVPPNKEKNIEKQNERIYIFIIEEKLLKKVVGWV